MTERARISGWVKCGECEKEGEKRGRKIWEAERMGGRVGGMEGGVEELTYPIFLQRHDTYITDITQCANYCTVMAIKNTSIFTTIHVHLHLITFTQVHAR